MMTTISHSVRDIVWFQMHFPVGRSARNGLWGWRRYNGALNLDCCRWATEDQASRDRDEHYAEFARDPEPYGYLKPKT